MELLPIIGCMMKEFEKDIFKKPKRHIRKQSLQNEKIRY
jgi:hypothetical protein